MDKIINHRKYSLKYYQTNREAINEKRRKRNADPEVKAKKKEYNAAYYQQRCEEIKDNVRQYRQDNYEAVREREKERWHAHRKHVRYRRGNVSPEQFAAMLLEHNGVCAICKKPETALHPNGNPKPLCVDHNHKTGQVRGLLCGRCNTAIGQFQEDIVRMQSAIAYIQKYGQDQGMQEQQPPANINQKQG